MQVRSTLDPPEDLLLLSRSIYFCSSKIPSLRDLMAREPCLGALLRKAPPHVLASEAFWRPENLTGVCKSHCNRTCRLRTRPYKGCRPKTHAANGDDQKKRSLQWVG